MVITRTYKYKLYRSKSTLHLNQQIDVAGIIWNHCIALHRRYYRLTGKHLGANQLKKHITKIKKLPKYAFWCMVGSQAIQDIAERIDRAYKLFFRKMIYEFTTSKGRKSYGLVIEQLEDGVNVLLDDFMQTLTPR